LAPTAVAEYCDGKIERYTLAPTDFGLSEKPHHPCEEPAEAAARVEATLAGTDDTHLDAVLFNAGIRINLGGRADSIEAGIAQARETITTGAARQKLIELRGQ
jgi:anthranilate phosphoribosyltransferase